MSYTDADSLMDNVVDTAEDIEVNLDKKIKSEKMFIAIEKEFG